MFQPTDSYPSHCKLYNSAFFRIERTGSPAGGPARSLLPVRHGCPHPHSPGLIRDGQSPAGLYKTGMLSHEQPFAQSVNRCSILVIHPPAPAPARHNHMCHAPTASQRLRRTGRFAPTRIARHPCRAPPLSHSFSPPGWSGASRPRLRRPAIPPPTPTSAHGTPLAAPSAKSVSRPGSTGALPTVHSPLHLSGSAPCFSASPACQIDSLVPAVANPRLDRSWTPTRIRGRRLGFKFVGFRPSCPRRSVRTVLPPAACPSHVT
jgi:hypothetical protein